MLTWEFSPAPQFASARLAAPGRNSQGETAGIEDLDLLPPVGSKVLIRPPDQAGDAELPGIVTGHVVNSAPDGNRLEAEVQHYLTVVLAQPIKGRWEWSDGAAEEVQNVRTRFNGEDGTWASTEQVQILGRSARAFTTQLYGQPWSVADALAYLLAACVPSDVEVPGPQELEESSGDIDLDRMDVSGLPTGEALVKVAHAGGLEIRAARNGLGLVTYRPGRQGRRRHVYLQPAGSELDIAETNLLRSRIAFRRRPSRRSVAAFGQRKQYEATFTLQSGWDSSLETDRWLDFVRSESDEWREVADVYRKWVLNEHGWYCDPPWSLSRFDFDQISEEDFFLHGPRRFLPCVSTNAHSQGLGVVVEYRTSDADPWRHWRGPVWTSEDECAVYLGGDALPGDYFQAAVAHEAQVRVTATIEADAQLSVEIPGDPNAPREVIDLSRRAAWRKVHETSAFYSLAQSGQANERDDTDMLERVARRYAEVASISTDAVLVLGWLNASYYVGDIIERIDGRALEMSSNPEGKAFVRSVRHDFGPRQTTTLHLSA